MITSTVKMKNENFRVTVALKNVITYSVNKTRNRAMINAITALLYLTNETEYDL